MPAHRLPWVKLWPELLESDKVRQLGDKYFRTWIYTLLSASLQTTRWRFDSLAHISYVTRRPLSHVQLLVDKRFLDVRENGVWIHDAGQYQDVHPSDVLPKHSANAPPNGQLTLADPSPESSPQRSTQRSANDSPNAPSRATLERERERERERKREMETETENVRPPVAPQGARAARRPTGGGTTTTCWKCQADQDNGAVQGHKGPCEFAEPPEGSS